MNTRQLIIVVAIARWPQLPRSDACVSCRALVVVVACCFWVSTHADAATTNWNISASGSFASAANWDNGVPDGDDTAVFNRGFVAYEVNFPGGSIFDPPLTHAIDALRVRTNEVGFVWNPIPFQRSPGLSALDPGQSIIIGEGAGDVAILNMALNTLSGTNASLGRVIGAQGTLNVFGTVNLSGSLNVGEFGTGTLNIAAGRTVSSGTGAIGPNQGSSGQVTVNAGATWANSGSLLVGGNFNPASANARLDVNGGGVVSVTDVLQVNPSGLLAGNGLIQGNVLNRGSIAPGTSVGTLHIVGNYEQPQPGELLIELAAAGSFDRLDIEGNLTLGDANFTPGGRLNVSLMGGYSPELGASFDILDWTGSRSGSFGLVQLPPLAAGRRWDTSQLNTSGVLSVVPAAFEVAGELYVDLDARDASAGTALWVNNGSLMDFVAVGDPTVGMVGTAPAVIFDGIDDAYQQSGAEVAPAGLVGPDPTRSIEAWVFNPQIGFEEPIVAWGRRDGPDGTNMSFNYGTEGLWGAVSHWGEADLGWGPSPASVPAAGRWHHLVYTYDGTTTRVYADGVLLNSEVLGAGVINTHAGTKITLASQLGNDGVTLAGTPKGSLGIGRLRIHDGVLTDAQILNNWIKERDSFGDPEPPTPPTPSPLQTAPIHRYSFTFATATGSVPGDGSFVVSDSIGGAHGVVRGAGAASTNSTLTLPGGSSTTQAYVDLPNGLISGLTDVTLEGWVTRDGSQNWSRIFDFGSSQPGGANGEITGPGDTNGGGTDGLDYVTLTAQVGADTSGQRVEIRNADPSGAGDIDSAEIDGLPALPDAFHFAVVYDIDYMSTDGDPFTPPGPALLFYRNGQLATLTATKFLLSDINDVNNWLGRSNWVGDANFQGTFDEFRIYDRALSQNEILGNFQAGPDVMDIAAGIPGDFNGDGAVNAADYIVWRNGMGTTYAQADYEVWRSHFGQTAGSGASLPSAEPLSDAVPEPSTLGLTLLSLLGLLRLRNQRV